MFLPAQCAPLCPCVLVGLRVHTCVYTLSARLSPSLEQILKLCPKKKSSSTYTFCKSVGLLGMGFHLFENECESPSALEMWLRVLGRSWRLQGGGRGQAPQKPHPTLHTGPDPASLTTAHGRGGLGSAFQITLMASPW